MFIRGKNEEIINVGDTVQFEEEGIKRIGKLVYSTNLDMMYITVNDQFFSLYRVNYDTLAKL